MGNLIIPQVFSIFRIRSSFDSSRDNGDFEVMLAIRKKLEILLFLAARGHTFYLSKNITEIVSLCFFLRVS